MDVFCKNTFKIAKIGSKFCAILTENGSAETHKDNRHL